nr:hypothetical protein [Tanacetum cinerariifolium]
MLRGRLLASFQNHEHEGGDTRSQGGIKDNVSKIKIQYHSMHMISQRNSQEQGSKIQEREVSYRLELPNSSQIHPVFHISQLKKCHGKDHSVGVLPQLREDGLLENKPMAILERRIKKDLMDSEKLEATVGDESLAKASFESHPPMLNKENYVPWSSRLLRYAKSRPNGKLIHNSILNGPYVRRMIPEPGDANRKVNVTETFYLQTDDELSEKELKQIEADDQAIQTILLDLPEDIYAAVDSCETAQEIWLRVQQMMKGSDIGIQEKKAKLFNEWERFTSNEGESIESYYHRFLKLVNDLKRNKHFPEKIASNLKFLNNLQPEWSRHVTIVHQTKDLHTPDYTQLYDFLKYNQKEMVGGNGGNQFRQYAGQNVRNPAGYNDVIGNQLIQNPRVQNGGNQNGLIGVQGNRNQNQIGNGNLVVARAEGNAAEQNRNQIRYSNCKGVEEYDLMAAAVDLDEIEKVNANCILMANLQQASTSGTQTDSAPIYNTDGSAEVHENCDDNEIFNMFTQEEQYTKLLEPIPKSHQVPQNDNDYISEDTNVKQGGETVEQHPVNFEETRTLYESLYQHLAIEVEKLNSVNRKLKETNADLTTELARFKNQERCFGINQEKYDKHERCYQQSVY